MPPPDPDAAHYAAGSPLHHMNASSSDIPNFDVVDASSPIAAETTRGALHLAERGVFRPTTNAGAGTVYKKAPGAPKRFKTNYVHFFTHFVEKKKKQLGPDGLPLKLNISSVSKECSHAWKSLPAEQRTHWDLVSEREKQEYIKQKEAYQGPWRIATSRVKKKKEGAPKRSPSAFFLFVNFKRPEIKAKYPDMANTDVVKTCSEVWKEISDSEKAPFKEEEKKLRARYHFETEKWKKRLQEHQEGGSGQKTSGEREMVPLEPVLHPGHAIFMHPPGYVPPSVAAAASAAPSRGKKRKKDPNAPKRSPPAFFLFVNHCRGELKMQYPELRHTELVKMLGQKWSHMSEEEKKPFRDHEAQLRQQYHIDVELYRKSAVPEEEYTDLESYHQNIQIPDVPDLAEPTEPQPVHSPHKEINYQQPTTSNQVDYRQSIKEEDLSHQTMDYFD
ncbi:hypothetical protein ACHAXR_006659 [Thalassiosira sp. AJA248-18]